MKINILLKLDAAVFLVMSLWLYSISKLNWWLFIIFIFAPDIFMIGYFKNNKIGALIYNLGHVYLVPIGLFFIYWFFHFSPLLPISIIWFAHISMDRMLGYGLKLDTGFTQTHLK